MMQTKVVWRQYRDESGRMLPQKLVDLVQEYKAKTGRVPTVIGLPTGYGDETLKMLSERFRVQQVVPRWAKHEIWLGVEVSDASL